MSTRSRGRSSPFRSLLRGLGLLFSILILLIGVVVLYAGIQNYFSAEAQGAAFGTTVLGLAITSLPLALYFSAKAAKSYKKSKSQYELPDTPMRFFLYTAFSAGFFLLLLVSVLMFIMYVRT